MAFDGQQRGHWTDKLVAGPGQRLVQLTRGYVALIDEIDFEKLQGLSFHAHMSMTNMYARNKKLGYLHHVVAGKPKPGMIVDHQNGNSLDCTRNNLRHATPSQNGANANQPRSKSGYRGVCVYGMAYRACINIDQKTVWLGTFRDPIEAAKAYDAKALELHGEFAWTNFPRDLSPPPVVSMCDSIPF